MKRKSHNVKLTDQAHLLLSEKVDDYRLDGHKISMKDIASEAIFMLAQSEDRDNEHLAHIEQLKFKALKFKQLAVFYVLLAGVGLGLLGFIVGLVVK